MVTQQGFTTHHMLLASALTCRWADIAEQWADGLPHVDFVFPTAPTRPVTLNGGMPMTAWCACAGEATRSCPSHSCNRATLHAFN